jgi:hypothetical protein
MTTVGIHHHGVLFTFEVNGTWAALTPKETIVSNEREALKHYGSIALSELDQTALNLFRLDPSFRSRVLQTARVLEKARGVQSTP